MQISSSSSSQPVSDSDLLPDDNMIDQTLVAKITVHCSGCGGDDADANADADDDDDADADPDPDPGSDGSNTCWKDHNSCDVGVEF